MEENRIEPQRVGTQKAPRPGKWLLCFLGGFLGIILSPGIPGGGPALAQSTDLNSSLVDQPPEALGTEDLPSLISPEEMAVERARALLDQGLAEEAASLLLPVVEKDPDHTLARYLLALAYLLLVNEVRAQELLEPPQPEATVDLPESTKVEPALPVFPISPSGLGGVIPPPRQPVPPALVARAYFEAGSVLIWVPGKRHIGMHYLNRAYQRDPRLRRTVVHLYYAAGLGALNDNKWLAHELLRRARRLQPSLIRDERFALAFYVDSQNRSDTLIRGGEAFLQRFPASPRVPYVLYRMAEAYTGLGKRKDARRLYERLIQQYPTSEYARRARAYLGLSPAEGSGATLQRFSTDS